MISMIAGLAYAGVDYSCTGAELYPFAKQWNEWRLTSYRKQFKAKDMNLVMYFQEFVADAAFAGHKKEKLDIPDIPMERLHKIAWEALHNNRDRHDESAAKLIIEALEKRFPKKKSKKWWAP